MSKYYNPQRTRNLFDPKSSEPFRLSRSKLELFSDCPKCFYLDRRLGIGRPPGFPFSLNSAVDALLKREFDLYREKKSPHPLMISHGIDCIPFAHERLDEWRDSLRRGITFSVAGTRFVITGGVDDLWIKPNNFLVVVDYKATSKAEDVTLDAEWQDGYKRQMEIYQWLLRMNGFDVDDTGIFVYCNGKADANTFEGILRFNIKLIPYQGSATWVDDFLQKVFDCLHSDKIPDPSENCDYCRYVDAVRDIS